MFSSVLSVPSHCISFCILIFSPQKYGCGPLRTRMSAEREKATNMCARIVWEVLLHEWLFPIEVERAKNQGCVTLRRGEWNALRP